MALQTQCNAISIQFSLDKITTTLTMSSVISPISLDRITISSLNFWIVSNHFKGAVKDAIGAHFATVWFSDPNVRNENVCRFLRNKLDYRSVDDIERTYVGKSSRAM